MQRFSDWLIGSLDTWSAAVVSAGDYCAHVPEQDDEPDDEPYDDSKDHTLCPDCKGTGEYVGLGVRERCELCMGSGWI